MPRQTTESIFPIVMEDVSFQAGGVDILRRINLHLNRGGCTAIMGFNGAGKSVLLRLLHGLLEPSDGRISRGTFGSLNDAKVKAHQGMVFQQPVLLRRSVKENIDFVLRRHGISTNVRETRCKELLAMGDLEHLASRPARALSGGERQRVAMVRALSMDPEILFLDEPTASLDPGSSGAIERLLALAIERGTTAVLVSHNRGQAKRLADHVVFLHQGEIVEQSNVRAFFDRPSSPAAIAYTEGRLP